jgi:hypothetical protein
VAPCVALTADEHEGTMGSEEHTRAELFRTLQRALGEEAASALMERLPPHPWTEIATKSDIADLRAHVDRVEGRLLGHVEHVEQRLLADADDREGRLLGHVEHVEQRLLADAGEREERLLADAERREERLLADAALREERVSGGLRGEMNTLITTQTRTMAFTLLGAIAAHTVAVVAALQLAL